jgi:hypothetical protein
MKAFRTVVVAVILTAMFSPAMALAKSEPRTPPAATETVTLATALARAASMATTGTGEVAEYARREQKAQDLQNFRGGFVYVYFGSGLVLALVIILLLIIL